MPVPLKAKIVTMEKRHVLHTQGVYSLVHDCHSKAESSKQCSYDNLCPCATKGKHGREEGHQREHNYIVMLVFRVGSRKGLTRGQARRW